MFGIVDCAKDADTIYSVNVQMGTNLMLYSPVQRMQTQCTTHGKHR